MIFKQLFDNKSSTYTYIISSGKGREALIIDPVIENTNEYNGLYHILGGLISPMEGINPSDLNIESLLYRIQKNNIKETEMLKTFNCGVGFCLVANKKYVSKIKKFFK